MKKSDHELARMFVEQWKRTYPNMFKESVIDGGRSVVTIFTKNGKMIDMPFKKLRETYDKKVTGTTMNLKDLKVGEVVTSASKFYIWFPKKPKNTSPDYSTTTSAPSEEKALANLIFGKGYKSFDYDNHTYSTHSERTKLYKILIENKDYDSVSK